MPKPKRRIEERVVAATGTSPCDEGTEILQEAIYVRPQERIEVVFTVCGTPAMAVVFVGQQRVFEQRIVNAIAVPIAAPLAGQALILAAIAPMSSPWKAKCEIAVGGAVVFRHKKTSESGFPVPKWAVWVRVMP